MIHKIKYYLIRLKTIDWKSMWKHAKKIGRKVKKSAIYIWFDMVMCSFKYQAGYMDYHEFEFYLLNKEERKTYITVGINNEITRKYTDKKYWYKLNDKAVFNEIFDKFIKRDWLNLNNSSLDDFKKFLEGKDQIIVKPIDDYAGKGIEIIKINKKTSIKKLYQQLIDNHQTLVEEVIKQHKDMAKLYDKSVNTLRIITFLKDDNEPVLLKSVLKMGNGGVIDNFAAGGMYTFVDEKGVVYAPAFDKDGNIYETHPSSGTNIVGFKVPLFKEVVKTVLEAQKMIPEIRYVGWDVAITPDGPVIVEGNEKSGAFQLKPSLSKDKIGDLPNYRKYMDI